VFISVPSQFAAVPHPATIQVMNLDEIKSNIRNGKFRLSLHAEVEAEAENLRIGQIVEAVLDGQVLEAYPDTGRGESCLIVGFAEKMPVHVVCGTRTENVIIVTVYIPGPPKFLDPWTRSGDET
jgi:hypothetical protein